MIPTVSRVIAAPEPSWIAPFAGVAPGQFNRVVRALRRKGADVARRGWPWGIPLENRAILVAAYWRTNLTLRQLVPLFGDSKSAAGRIVRRVGPLLAFRPRKRFHKDAVLIVDGTLVPTRDHAVAERSKNYRYSTNHRVVIDADTQLVVLVGRPLPGNRNDCKAWELSPPKAAAGNTAVIADRGYRGTGLVIPHRRCLWTGQTARLEGRAQLLSLQGPCSGRACLRPDEDLEDPARLPPQRRWRVPRDARHRPSAQPRASRLTAPGPKHCPFRIRRPGAGPGRPSSPRPPWSGWRGPSSGRWAAGPTPRRASRRRGTRRPGRSRLRPSP